MSAPPRSASGPQTRLRPAMKSRAAATLFRRSFESFIEHRLLRRLSRLIGRPQPVAQAGEDGIASGDRRRIRSRYHGSTRGGRGKFLGGPDVQGSRSELVTNQSTGGPDIVPVGVDRAAIVIGTRDLVAHLPGIVGNGTERPLADRLGRGEFGVQDIARRIAGDG